MKDFEYCVFIGRFQPFHLAHKEILNEALKRAEKVVVVIGSHNKAPDIKNPWSSDKRAQMIYSSLCSEDSKRIYPIYMRDYLYNDNIWITDLQQKVYEKTGGSDSIALIGNEHDRGSFYLKLFPQWKFISMKNIDKYARAIEIRRLYFTHDIAYKKYVTENVANYMEVFKTTAEFAKLKEEFDFIRQYSIAWEGAPFPPTFVTVDSVVIKSGHVLVVRRKCNPGKGLIALPGGFLSQHEFIKVSAIRELREETGIKVSREDLESAIVDQMVFDHPNRSLRGRTVTHAFLINLKSGPLPQVKGNDDTYKAWWMPLSEFYISESEFFEDHWHIISFFVNRF
jgi:bifunctional NMN adenylyltransferase/nudix hydrolase